MAEPSKKEPPNHHKDELTSQSATHKLQPMQFTNPKPNPKPQHPPLLSPPPHNLGLRIIICDLFNKRNKSLRPLTLQLLCTRRPPLKPSRELINEQALRRDNGQDLISGWKGVGSQIDGRRRPWSLSLRCRRWGNADGTRGATDGAGGSGAGARWCGGACLRCRSWAAGPRATGCTVGGAATQFQT